MINRDALQRHRTRQARFSTDERGSMAILMMVMLVGLMLSSLLVPMIITQDRTTRFDTTRVQALDAAQSGIDVTLGLIRASTTSGIGDITKLPCGTITGVVNSTGAAAYSTAVNYFTVNPDTIPAPTVMQCTAGSGTFVGTTSTTPSFARLTSTGTVPPATNGSTTGRTLTTTYVFRTANVNLLGGQIATSVPGSPSSCVDAGSSTATSGTAVSLLPCNATVPPTAQQTFAYRTDLTLQLLSSITATNALGLCLAWPVSGSSIQLNTCGSLGTPVSTQQWSYINNGNNGNYQAAQSNSSTTNLCMTASAQAPGQLVLGDCSSATSWSPSPSMGPGAAASSQRLADDAQWVNYKEFGRCLDVTGRNPDTPFLIDSPCTKNPYPGTVQWDQLFSSPAIPTAQSSVVGQILTNNTSNGQQYCLTSPGTNGGYVTVKSCSGSAAQSWTIYDGDNTLNYSTKYTVVSGYPVASGQPQCLGLSATGTEGAPWSVIDVEPCNGSTKQKWNADPNLLTSTSTNIHEK